MVLQENAYEKLTFCEFAELLLRFEPFSVEVPHQKFPLKFVHYCTSTPQIAAMYI